MKNLKILLLIPLSLVGCFFDEPDMLNEPSFSKVYGFDGPSFGQDVILNREGNFIIVGNFSRTGNYVDGEVDPNFPSILPIQAPYIIEADGSGNQIKFRSFPIAEGNAAVLGQHWKDVYGWSDIDSTIRVNYDFTPTPSFYSVIQLQNDNYFVTGNVFGELGSASNGFMFIMILDPDFNIVEFKFLNNSAIELQNDFKRNQHSNNSKLRMRENGEVLLFNPRVLINNSCCWDGYSLYRFNEDGEILNVVDIPWTESRDYLPFHFSWTLDGPDHIVTTTLYLDDYLSTTEDSIGDNNIWVQRVNIETGTAEKTVIFGDGNFMLNGRCGIIKTANGFAIGDYHIDTIGERNFDPDGDGFRNLYGGLWFLDNNLDSVGKAHMTEAEVHWQRTRLLQTRDGGIVAGYQRFGSDGDDWLFVKSDEMGNVLWRKVFEIGMDGSEGLNAMPISKMIEAADGGIVILSNINHNETGNKVNLIKLTKDGNL